MAKQLDRSFWICQTSLVVAMFAVFARGAAHSGESGDTPNQSGQTEMRDIALDPECRRKLVDASHFGLLLPEADDGERVPQQEIYEDAADMMRACIAEVLRPELLPPQVKPKDLPMQGIRRGDGGFLVSEVSWSGARIVLTGGYTSIGVLVRIPGEKWVSSSPLEAPGTQQLLDGLRRVVRVPYGSANDVELHGKVSEVCGTNVYTVWLERAGAEVARKRLERRDSEIAWYDSINVLVSDSIPQYVELHVGKCASDPVPENSRATAPRPFATKLPPRAEADSDPDVVKRPLFRKALSRGKGGPNVPELNFDPLWSSEHPGAPIPDNYKATIERLSSGVLNAAMQPSSRSDIEWRWRDLYGHRAPEQNPITARWEKGGRRVTVLGTADSTTLVISLRIPGNERLTLRPRPESGAASEPSSKEWREWQSVDKEALRRVLATMFQFPFAAVEDFVVQGGASVVEGVPVLGGRIESKYFRFEHSSAEPDADSKLRWYDYADLFVTDSDPQYFCITIGRLGPAETVEE